MTDSPMSCGHCHWQVSIDQLIMTFRQCGKTMTLPMDLLEQMTAAERAHAAWGMTSARAGSPETHQLDPDRSSA